MARRSVYALGVAAFLLAVPLQPLFFVNQNTYLSHAVAGLAGSRLAGDWFIGTTDPAPVFTSFARWLMKAGGHPAIYAATLACFAAYFAALLAVARRGARIDGGHAPAGSAALLIAGLVVLHAVPSSSPLSFLGDFTRGVADHYLLGSSLQPSMSGILLLAGVALFQRDRFVWAAVAIGAAPILHPTYLLPSLILAAACVIAAWPGTPAGRQAGAIAGSVFGILLLASVVKAVSVVWGSSGAQVAQAQTILTDWRIPHHARPSIWFPHVSTWLQIGIMVAGAIAAPDARTRRVLTLALGAGVLLTLATVASRSLTLALLFPWRVSAVLVPAAAAIIIARVVAAGPGKKDTRRLFVAIAVLLVAAIHGAVVTRSNFEPRVPDAERTLAAVARQDPRLVTYLVPILWENFRLLANAPIVVDVKSNPWAPADVIEWYTRVTAVQALYEQPAADCARWLAVATAYHAGAVVAPGGRLDACGAFAGEAPVAGYQRYFVRP